MIDDDSQQEGSTSNEKTKLQEKAKVAIQMKDVKKLERQRGDIGLYRFYFFSSGIWQYIVWMFMAAINMLWSQMPRITHILAYSDHF